MLLYSSYGHSYPGIGNIYSKHSHPGIACIYLKDERNVSKGTLSIATNA
jgi:hypothetical protein